MERIKISVVNPAYNSFSILIKHHQIIYKVLKNMNFINIYSNIFI